MMSEANYCLSFPGLDYVKNISESTRGLGGRETNLPPVAGLFQTSFQPFCQLTGGKIRGPKLSERDLKGHREVNWKSERRK